MTKAEQVGLNCACGENLRNAYVARSYPIPGGQRRERYCPGCHEKVDSLERIEGVSREGLLIADISALTATQVRIIRAVFREFGAKFEAR